MKAIRLIFILFTMISVKSAYCQHNPTDNFINEYLQACKADSYKAFMSANKGLEILAARVGNYHERALNNFNKAIELDTMYCDAYFLAGSMYRILGKPEKAIELARKSNEINENPSACVTIGNAYILLEQSDTAIDAFDKAISLEPGAIDGYYGKAQGLYHLEKFSDAISTLEDGNRNVDNVIPYNKPKIEVLLGKVYFKINDPRAMATLSGSKGKLANDPEGSYFLGKLYLDKDSKKKAEKYIMQAKGLGYEIEPDVLKMLQSN